MLKELYADKNLKWQLMVFVCLQPFIEIYRQLFGNAIQVFGISMVELVNILFTGYFAILFILNRQSLKRLLVLGTYAVMVGVYILLHSYNVLKFDTAIMSGTAISIFVEIYVILRAYLVPVVLLYIMISIRTDQQTFLKTMVSVSLFISCVIVLTNIFKISYVAYSSYLEEETFITQNIFEWFYAKTPDDVSLLTSKGWFYSGNRIGLILLMLFPLVVYYAITSKKKIGFAFIGVQAAAMFMVSTKTAAYGVFLVLGLMMALLVFFGIQQKCIRENMKQIIPLFLICALSFGIFLYSPVIKMNQNSDDVYQENEVTDDMKTELDNILQNEEKPSNPENNTGEDNSMSVQEFSKFLNQHHNAYNIHKDFIELLPVEKYASFWIDVVNDETKSQIDFRNFKVRLYNEVLKKNGNPLDSLLGIGYSSNFPYIEIDVISQTVWFGILGTLLFLGPFFGVLAYCAIQILRDMKKRFTLYNCVLGISLCAGIAICLIAGHMFGYVFPMVIFAYILSHLKQSVRQEITVSD